MDLESNDLEIHHSPISFYHAYKRIADINYIILLSFSALSNTRTSPPHSKEQDIGYKLFAREQFTCLLLAHRHRHRPTG